MRAISTANLLGTISAKISSGLAGRKVESSHGRIDFAIWHARGDALGAAAIKASGTGVSPRARDLTPPLARRLALSLPLPVCGCECPLLDRAIFSRFAYQPLATKISQCPIDRRSQCGGYRTMPYPDPIRNCLHVCCLKMSSDERISRSMRPCPRDMWNVFGCVRCQA